MDFALRRLLSFDRAIHILEQLLPLKKALYISISQYALNQHGKVWLLKPTTSRCVFRRRRRNDKYISIFHLRKMLTATMIRKEMALV